MMTTACDDKNRHHHHNNNHVAGFSSSASSLFDSSKSSSPFSRNEEEHRFTPTRTIEEQEEGEEEDGDDDDDDDERLFAVEENVFEIRELGGWMGDTGQEEDGTTEHEDGTTSTEDDMHPPTQTATTNESTTTTSAEIIPAVATAEAVVVTTVVEPFNVLEQNLPPAADDDDENPRTEKRKEKMMKLRMMMMMKKKQEEEESRNRPRMLRPRTDGRVLVVLKDNDDEDDEDRLHGSDSPRRRSSRRSEERQQRIHPEKMEHNDKVLLAPTRRRSHRVLGDDGHGGDGSSGSQKVKETEEQNDQDGHDHHHHHHTKSQTTRKDGPTTHPSSTKEASTTSTTTVATRKIRMKTTTTNSIPSQRGRPPSVVKRGRPPSLVKRGRPPTLVVKRGRPPALVKRGRPPSLHVKGRGSVPNGKGKKLLKEQRRNKGATNEGSAIRDHKESKSSSKVSQSPNNVVEPRKGGKSSKSTNAESSSSSSRTKTTTLKKSQDQGINKTLKVAVVSKTQKTSTHIMSKKAKPPPANMPVQKTIRNNQQKESLKERGKDKTNENRKKRDTREDDRRKKDTKNGSRALKDDNSSRPKATKKRTAPAMSSKEPSHTTKRRKTNSSVPVGTEKELDSESNDRENMICTEGETAAVLQNGLSQSDLPGQNPKQNMEKNPLTVKPIGSEVLWVEKADRRATPFSDASHFIRIAVGPTEEETSTTATTTTTRRKRKKNEFLDNMKIQDPEDRKRSELSKGNDIDLVRFQTVQRIDATQENAAERISELRQNGIPFVLTGHPTWPPFASRWIEDDVVVSSHPNKDEENGQSPPKTSTAKKLRLENLIADIGEEDVPIVEKNYDERNPVKSVIKASEFLNNHWSIDEEDPGGWDDEEQIYMQQWQFTSSPVAEILCGDDDCRPPSVLHEDLVSHWLNDGGNPYQYLFMGSAGTMSKLHKDPGGLDILIAPMLGEKECILVHRDDGKYLYDCRSKLDAIDLNRFPLTACARVWKTVVQAGEILVMPHDTYHQCRNVTSCLSYHRLHLDYVNMPGFLNSMFQQDDFDESIDHAEIIWNSVSTLCDKVDEYVEDCRLHTKMGGTSADMAAVDPSIEEYILTLRALRPFCMHLSRPTNETMGKLPLSPRFSMEGWMDHTREVDKTLFNYRHRTSANPPRFRYTTTNGHHRHHHLLEGGGVGVAESDEDSLDEDAEKMEYRGRWSVDTKFESLWSALVNLPPCTPEEEGLIISDTIPIEPKDVIQVRLPEVYRCAEGVIKKKMEMEAVFVSYDDLPTEFDEFLPLSAIQGSASSSRSAIILGKKSSNQAVRCIPSGTRTKQDAKVLRRRTGTFYYVTLNLDSNRRINRWISRGMILRKIK